VLQGTGKSLSEWRNETRPGLVRPWLSLVLEPDRTTLYARCERRLLAMIDKGAMDEARALSSRRLDPNLPAMKAVGMREFGRYFAGEITREAAIFEAQRATRNYAKRQLTWFRHQTADWPRLTDIDADAARRLLSSSQA
jgi:tRNA dimethylallyltransferase